MNGQHESSGQVLVTGGASGVGAAISRELARRGHQVWINYRSREADARSLAGEINAAGGVAHVVHADVTDPESVAAMFETIGAAGGVSFLVHAAAAPIEEARIRRAPWRSFAEQFNVAVGGAYNCVRSWIGAAGQQTPQAAVIVLSSVTRGIPPVGHAAYVTAKHALLGFAKCLAVELAPKAVRVNSVSPGFVGVGLTSGTDPRVLEVLRRATPLGRLCEPQDVATAVAFLLSADARFITGVDLPVTGGTVP